MKKQKLNFRSFLFSISIIVLISFLFVSNTDAQNLGVTFNIETKACTSNKAKDGEITISVTSISNGYSFYIYNKEPWNKGKELQSRENISEAEFTFTKLKAMNYYICVVDNEGKTRCENIILEYK